MGYLKKMFLCLTRQFQENLRMNESVVSIGDKEMELVKVEPFLTLRS